MREVIKQKERILDCIDNWLRTILLGIAIRCFVKSGYTFLDIKRDKTGEFVEAITISNNEEYINKISEIE